MVHTLTILYTHRLIADALKCMIECQTDLKVGYIQKLDTKVVPLHKHKTSLILIEISFPTTKLIHIIKRLKKLGYKIMVVGLMIENGFLEEILDAKVDAYLLKTCEKLSLQLCLEQVINGSKFFCHPITERLNAQLHNKIKPTQQLTNREKDVLRGIVNYNNTEQIAEELNITLATVRTHRKNIMLKLGAKNYIGLLRRACSMGLLCDTDDHFCDGCLKNKPCNSTF